MDTGTVVQYGGFQGRNGGSGSVALTFNLFRMQIGIPYSITTDNIVYFYFGKLYFYVSNLGMPWKYENSFPSRVSNAHIKKLSITSSSCSCSHTTLINDRRWSIRTGQALFLEFPPIPSNSLQLIGCQRLSTVCSCDMCPVCPF